MLGPVDSAHAALSQKRRYLVFVVYDIVRLALDLLVGRSLLVGHDDCAVLDVKEV
jgi:hypothetical protein